MGGDGFPTWYSSGTQPASLPSVIPLRGASSEAIADARLRQSSSTPFQQHILLRICKQLTIMQPTTDYDLSQGESPESTTSYGLHFLEMIRRTKDKRYACGIPAALPC
jgi:hypothetical protein